VNPDRMIEAGHLQVVREVRQAVREDGRADQMEVRHVGQQRTMEIGVIANPVDETHPYLVVGWPLGGLQLITRIHRAELEGAAAIKPALCLGRQRGQGFS